MTSKEPEAILWHTNSNLAGSGMERKQYHISIIDGNERLEMIVNYQKWDKLLTVEPYLAHELDYTVHDFCDHEDDYCVLDDPNSSEYQEAEEQAMHYNRVLKDHSETTQLQARTQEAINREKEQYAALVALHPADPGAWPAIKEQIQAAQAAQREINQILEEGK